MKSNINCQDCPTHNACLWTGLQADTQEEIKKMLKVRYLPQCGHTLFKMGDQFRSLYFIRSGSIKCSSINLEGEENVTRFGVSGDILGLNAVSSGTYDCTATALEISSVCEMSYHAFQQLANKTPQLNHRLLECMSREINHKERMMRLRGNTRAAVRLANFLSSISRDNGIRGYSTDAFYLSMRRCDIANYLGLALETVSRMFSQFQDTGMLRVDGKQIEITDSKRLSALSGL